MNFVISFLVSFASIFLIYLLPIKRLNRIQLYIFSVVLFSVTTAASVIWTKTLVSFIYSVDMKTASMSEMREIKPFLNFIGLLIAWLTVGMLLTSANNFKFYKNNLLVKIPSGLTLILSLLLLLAFSIAASTGRMI